MQLALSPPLFPSFGWPLEDPISHEQSYNIFRDSETPESLPYFPPLSHQPELINLDPSATSFSTGDHDMAKKLNHNASERDRRKKINSLYSSLRSLLPAADKKKKLSIPATISLVLKYIPELQQQVEKLVQKKQELLTKISREDDHIINQANQGKLTHQNSSIVVSVNPLTDTEFVIQISTSKIHQTPFSEILLSLEDDGLVLVNSSSFISSDDMAFHSLHIQVEETVNLDCMALRQKLVILYQKRVPMVS
ncbi:hypothetical protein K2173_010829 [Erythroxylum novogranatense]|uniref:BHLH domain-containing protein n=1 Tax=Erythroxylum novogranatense TaxID=1862640 RepID=A0AAV8T0A5_9ROSI|nr:hypothetical protein K2173_010829 [Erythroxylum novogranatense]